MILIAPYSDDCYFNFEDMDIDIKESVEGSDFKSYAKEVI